MPSSIIFVAFLLALRSTKSYQVPSWNTTIPDNSVNASAGLPVLSNSFYTVYNSTLSNNLPNPNGLFNHGPIITEYNNFFYISWMNSPHNESVYMRVLISKSSDGKIWSEPIVTIPNVTYSGERNLPFFVINNHLYTGGAIDYKHPALRQKILI